MYVCDDRCTQIKTYSWDNAQVILVGNKSDLEHERVVSTERGRRLANQLGNKTITSECKVLYPAVQPPQYSTQCVRSKPMADPAMGGPGGRPPPIDQNLGLVMAARVRHEGKFSHIFHLNPQLLAIFCMKMYKKL